MIIVGSDNRYLFRKFGDRLFDLDPRAKLPIADNAGNLELWEDLSKSGANLDSTPVGLGIEDAFDFDGDLTNALGSNNATRQKFNRHTGKTRTDKWIYCAADKLIEVPTKNFDVIGNEVTITVLTYGGCKFGIDNSWLFQGARDADTGVIVGAYVDNAGNVKFATGSQSGAPGTVDETTYATLTGDATEIITWTFTKNVVTGIQKIYKNGYEVASTSGDTLSLDDIERFVLAGSFASADAYKGRFGYYRMDNEVLIPEYIYHLARPEVASQDLPIVDVSTMAIATPTGGAETGAATKLGTKLGIQLEGDVRRSIDLGVADKYIGYNTYIEFDFVSNIESTRAAIGVSNAATSLDWTKMFQIFGTNNTLGIQDYNDYELTDFGKHYKIPIGKILGEELKDYRYIVVANDGDGNATFLNIRLVEEVQVNPLNQDINFGILNAYEPNDIAAMQCWLDPSDVTTRVINGSGEVTSMYDKTGNGNDGDGTGHEPNFNENDPRLNGMPTIGYDQAKKYLETPSFLARNVYLVTYFDGIFSTYRTVVSAADNTPRWQGRVNGTFQIDTNSGVAGIYKNADSTSITSSNVVVPMEPTMWKCNFDADYTENWRILAGDLAYHYWEFGAHGDVIFTDGTETLEEQQKIEGYLAWKFGIQSKLPVSHPYKYQRPLRGQVVQEWTPNDDLNTAAAWYDGADTDTILEAGVDVDTWQDKSVNNNHLTQVTEANRMASGVDTLNGLNVLSTTFDKYMTMTNPIELYGKSVFAVAKSNNARFNQQYLSNGLGANRQIRSNVNGSLQIAATDNAWNIPTSPITVINTGFAISASNTIKTKTLSFNAGAADKLIVQLGSEWAGTGGPDAITVTYNGVALKRCNASSVRSIDTWYLDNPYTGGAADLVVTFPDVIVNGMAFTAISVAGTAPGYSSVYTDDTIRTIDADSVLDNSFAVICYTVNYDVFTGGLNSPITTVMPANAIGSHGMMAGYQNGVSAGTNTYSVTSDSTLQEAMTVVVFDPAVTWPSYDVETAHMVGIIGDDTLKFSINGELTESYVRDSSAAFLLDTLGARLQLSNIHDEWSGIIAEIVIVDSVDPSILRKIEGYLAHKWGLQTQLPDNHPYRYHKPMVYEQVQDLIPTDVGVKGWFDAADTSSILDTGGEVDQWNDKSGFNYHVAKTGTARPTTGIRSLYGLNLIDFDGDDWLENTTSRFGLSANPDLMVLAVFIRDTTIDAADDRLWGIGPQTQVGTLSGGIGVTGFSWRYNDGNEVYGAVANDTAYLGVWTHPAGGTYEDSSFFRNGVEDAPTSNGNPTGVPTNTGVGFSIGNFRTVGGDADNRPIDGAVGEIIFVDKNDILTRQKIEGYLAHKWGLQNNLPYDHPYRFASPKKTVNYTVEPWTVADTTTEAWFDAKDPSTLVDTTTPGKLEQWTDKSPNARSVTQTVEGDKPDIGVDYVSFDGVSQYLYNTSPFMFDNGEIDVYIVCNATNARDKRIISEGNSGSAVPIYSPAQTYHVGDGAMSNFHRNDAVIEDLGQQQLSALNVFDDTRNLYSWRDTGSAMSGRVNGGTETTVNYTRSGTYTLNRFAIGALLRISPGSFVNADINEIVITSNLSVNDRLKMEGYLAHKWGLADNLPVDHLYKYNAPVKIVRDTVPFEPKSDMVSTWFSPASIVGPSDITSWDDLSNQPMTGHSFTSTPSRVVNALNGYDALRFNGFVETVINWVIPPPVSGNMAIVLCTKITGVQNTESSLYSLIQDTSNRLRLESGAVGQFLGKTDFVGHGTSVIWDAPVDLIDGNFHIITVVMDWTGEVLSSSGKHITYVDGVAKYTAADYTTKIFWNSGIFSADNSGTQKLDQDFLEIIAVEDIRNFKTVEGYLAHKYGITGQLDAGHPYKTNVPVFGNFEVNSESDIFLNSDTSLTLPIYYNVTADTKLQLEVEGEHEDDQLIVGVQSQQYGYLNNQAFKLWGSGATPPNVDATYDDYVGEGVRKWYEIPIGTYFTGLQTFVKLALHSSLVDAELRITNMQLVEPQVTPTDTDDSAILVYNMAETEGAELLDDSGNGNTGIIVKGVTLDLNNLDIRNALSQSEYPDHYASLVQHVTFDETSNGLFQEKIASSPIYGVGTPYPARIASQSGHAIQLLGTHYLAMDYTVPTSECTISFRFKTTNAGTMTLVSTGLGQAIAGADRYVELIAGEIRAFMNGETITSTGLTLDDGQWHHVVYRYGTTISGQQLYVDDVQVASGAQHTSTGTDHDFVGVGARDTSTNRFIGEIDDLRIYSDIVTPAEFAKIRAAYGTLSVDQLGRRLSVYKNTWCTVKFETGITITENTVLEFDFESTEEGEYHAIGFHGNTNPATASNLFKLFGAQTSGDDYDDYANYALVDGVKHYKIPVGQYPALVGLTRNYLSLINDNDAAPTVGNSSFSNIQIYDDPDNFNTVEGTSSAISLSGNELIEASSHPVMNGVDHAFAFSFKTTCKNATMLQHGDLAVNGYHYRINNDGYLSCTYVISGASTEVILPVAVNDNVFHRCVVYLNNAAKTLYVYLDDQSTSSVLANVFSAEPAGPLYIGGHDGEYAVGGHAYYIPDLFEGDIDFVKLNSGTVDFSTAMAMRQRVNVLPNKAGISFANGASQVLFNGASSESYGTIIVAVKMPSVLSAKITAVGGKSGSAKINLRASAGDVLGFEYAGVSEYPSTHSVSADEVLVLAITSVSGENQVYMSKNLSGRETLATAGDYMLPAEVLGELGPFELIRIVGYSSPLNETEERYLIRQTMKHPSVGLL